MAKRKVVSTETAEDSESQTLATPVKRQKKSGKSTDSPSTRHMTTKTSSSIRLTDLTIKDQQYLLEEAKKQLLADAQPRDYELLNIEYEKETYEVGYTVRYLHPAVRFAVKNSGPVRGYIATDPPAVPTKPGTNINLTKRMVGIATDSSRTKEWARTNTSKITSGKPVYLVISDGTSKETMDYANEISMDILNTKYQVKDSFGSLINERHVLFNSDYVLKDDRQDIANAMAKDHRDWKIQTHTEYRNQCESYIRLRKQWE